MIKIPLISQNTLVKSLITVVIFGMAYQSNADDCHIDVGNKYVQIFDKIAQVPNDTQVKYTEYRHYQSETNK